jgi:putative membrane protein
MNDMFQSGFLGTEAPFFMDITIIYMVLLPFLVVLAIWIAIKEYHSIHIKMQIILFIITLMLFIYSIYNISFVVGFSSYVQNRQIDSSFLLYFSIFYIAVESVTIIIWYYTIKFAIADRQRRALPGLYSVSHRKSGRVSAVLIIFASIVYISLYVMLFIF